MKCPKCQSTNVDDAKFCNECGNKLVAACPKCGEVNPPGSNFCNKCGQHLKEQETTPAVDGKPKSLSDRLEPQEPLPSLMESVGERKYVTVLFSDLSGYTAMSENLDPEEVKEIMGRIFGETAQVVARYEGFIDKFIGDAVMVIFGVPKAHEDDPVRAIRAAMEIHDVVKDISPRFEKRIGQPLSMHTGINTGLVVTGEMDVVKGIAGITGDTVNMASRLESLSKAGEILVGPVTYRQTQRYFSFEALEPTVVKGKAEPVQIYKVLSPKEQPGALQLPYGVRADLIGRKVEMALLREAVENLRDGKGTIICISGDAGTGKSRLIEEFKASVRPEKIQWREGHAYAYAQNTPYFPLIDLLNRAFKIEESDSPADIKEKIESSLEYLGEKKDDIVPFIGSLYSLIYPETEDVSPQFWKARLQESIKATLTGLVQIAPTVLCFEDLQWADPSSVELLRYTLSEFKFPALFLCVYRPTFTLFSSHQVESMGYSYSEITLQDLSPSDAQDMMESLLNTQDIPLELRRFIGEKLEGNPFYLEEVINSLIESQTLIQDDGTWRLTGAINEAAISPTIHGVISGRIDRLEKDTKRILQQASVIGRTFLYEILRRITDLETHIDGCLRELEQLDQIRTRSLQPDIEYVFKHTLTQEVVYNGLLKKERQAIHERIALVMEQLFEDRLPEFYEALAYHYAKGVSVHKAVDFLMKSGRKSHNRHALEEAHQYYKRAFDLLSNGRGKTKEDDELIINVLLEWGYVYNSRAAYRELEEILKANEALAESLVEKEGTGMFYAWLGWALRSREKLNEGYAYLNKALALGEELENQKIIGYACAWLAFTCSDMGLLDDAVAFGKRAVDISRLFEPDHELSRYAWVGMGMARYFRGESRKAAEVGEFMLDYGQKISDLRFTTMGYSCEGFGHYVAGDLTSAIECFKRAIQVSQDPIYSNAARLLLGMSLVADGQLQEAEKTLEEILAASKDFNFEFLEMAARSFTGIILMAKGDLSQGEKTVIDTLQVWQRNGSRYRCAQLNNALGKFYLQIVQRDGPKGLSFLVKNVGFLAKTLPFADRKAEERLNEAIRISEEIGAKGILGQAYFDLSLLHKAKKRTDPARECVSKAMQLFEQCKADVYLRQARDVLASLE